MRSRRRYAQGWWDAGQTNDPKYTALITYAQSQGLQLPTSTVLAALNRLCVRHTQYNLWSKRRLVYALNTTAGGAGDDGKAFSKLNIVSPGNFTLIEVSSPTFTAKGGWKSNGTTSYLRTGLNLLTDAGGVYSQNDIGSSCFLNDQVNANVIPYGCEVTGQSFYHNLAKAANLEIVRCSQATSGANLPLPDLKGRWRMSRISSGGASSYYNGLASVVNVVASVALPSKELTILASNDASAVEGFCTSGMMDFSLGSADIGNELLEAAIWAEYHTAITP